MGTMTKREIILQEEENGASSHRLVLSRSYPRNLVPGGPS